MSFNANKINTSSENTEDTVNSDRSSNEYTFQDLAEELRKKSPDEVVSNFRVGIEGIVPKMEDVIDTEKSFALLEESSISELAEVTSDPEKAKEIKDIINKEIEDEFAEEGEDVVAEYGEDAGIKIIAGAVLTRALTDNGTLDPEKRVDEAVRFVENIGFSKPMEPDAINLEFFGYDNKESYDMRGALESLGFIDKDFKKKAFKEQLGFTFSDNEPKWLEDLSDETFEYWEKQSEEIGCNALKVTEYLAYGIDGAFNDDGTLSDEVFKKDSDFIRRALKYMFEPYLTSQEIAETKLLALNADRMEQGGEKTLMEAARNASDEDLLSFRRVGQEARGERGYSISYRCFDDAGNPTEKFWRDALKDAAVGDCAKYFKEKGEHFSRTELAYLDIPNDYRNMVADYYDRIKGDDENLKINDIINQYFDESGPKKDFYQLTFSEGRFDLLDKKPLVPAEEMGLSEFQINALSGYSDIPDDALKKEYSDFIIGEVKAGREVPKDRIEVAPEVLKKLYTSNATEIIAHRSAIAGQILRSDVEDNEKMLEKLDEVEDVFVRNGLPMSGKTFSVFSILHDVNNLAEDFRIDENNERISPVLKAEAENGNLPGVIYKDLIKSYLGSSMQTAKDFDALLARFNMDTGFKTAEEALGYSKKKISEAHERNIEFSRHDLKLEEGDLVKGVGDIGYLGTILRNGSNAREFLGEGADSDATPLDTDMSRVFKDAESFDEGVSDLECRSYGPIFFVLKGERNGEDRFQTTRRSPLENGKAADEVDANSDKLEAFYTGAIGKHHYGIRTGFASSEIDGIVVRDSENTAKEVGLEVALNGFYIPVYDEKGKCIFTPEDYDKMRHEMSGLEYYEGMTNIEPDAEFAENYNYEFAEDLSIPGANLDRLTASVPEARKEVEERHKALDEVFARALSELGLERRDFMDLQTGNIQIIDTGSTGRGTNVPHDGDYDYMFKIDNADRNEPERMDNVRNAFLKVLGKENGLSEGEVANENIIRLKQVNVPGIEDPIEVDITFEQKTDKIQYSTDEALKRRIAAMRLSDLENGTNKTDEALANVIFAKKFCKSVGAYKPDRTPGLAENEKGGLGGVGVENWILRNGGSFVEAARSFVEAARGEDGRIKDFDEFKKGYQLFDFGENHMAKAGKSKHDNFVSRNMNEGGYRRLATALSVYLDAGTFPEGLEV